jgi:hypothetical protein
MKRLLLALVGLFASISVANADITVTQFFDNPAAGHDFANRIAKFDSSGNQTDFHDSQIFQWPAGTNNYYRYSEKYGCGSVYQNFGSWCGIHVWYSTDLGADGGPGWQDLGLLFPVASYLTRCDPASGGAGGCWTARMVRNAANSNFVFWMHDPSGTGNPAVFTCTAVTGGCTEQTRPTLGACGGNVDTVHVFVDDDAAAYLFYSCAGATGFHIDKLNSTYTNWNGVNTVDTGVVGEGGGILRKGSRYFAIYAASCPYCNGVAAKYITNDVSPTNASWSASTTINADSCKGQPEGISKVTIGGTDYYLWHSDLWTIQDGVHGFNNQGMAHEILVPLTFTGSAIDTIPCNNSFTIVNGSISPGTPSSSAAADQTDESSPFSPYCQIDSSNYLLQTFIPSASNLSTRVRVTTGQNLNACLVGNTSCSAINGNLLIDLVTLDGSKNPATVLGTHTVTPSDVGWSLTPITTASLGATTNGVEYGIRLRGTNTVGCWSFAYSDVLPYSAGVERQSDNGGSTWSTIANRSLRFAAGISIATVPFSGVAH